MSNTFSQSDLHLAELRCEAMGDSYLKWVLNDSNLDPAKIQHVDTGQGYINTPYIYLIFEHLSDGLEQNEVRVSWTNQTEDLYFYEDIPVAKDSPRLEDFEDEGEWLAFLIQRTMTKDALTKAIEAIFNTPARRNALLMEGLSTLVS